MERHGLRPPHARVGVALSGGADSVALLVALREAGYLCVALHCNFGLRGAESDRDAAFAEEIAARFGCQYFQVSFNVAERCETTGESVEMACRELRYDWFLRMATELELSCIAIGHHLEDSRETFFLNMMRGTGVTGLAGISERRGIFIRPLLGVTRSQIETYLTAQNLGWVTDSTNASNEFLRNRVRNSLLPYIERLFPGGTERIDTTVRNLRSDASLLTTLMQSLRERFRDGETWLLADATAYCDDTESFVFHLLTDFSGGIVAQLVQAVNEGASGKVFRDKSGGKWLLDRGKLSPLVTDVADLSDEITFTLTEPQTIPNCLAVSIVGAQDFKPDRNPNVLWLDGSIADEKLFWRAPRIADRIEPFGMRGSKLLSDLYRDARYSLTDKHRSRVLAMDDKILWAAGLRASRHYPVTPASTQIYRIEFLP